MNGIHIFESLSDNWTMIGRIPGDLDEITIRCRTENMQNIEARKVFATALICSVTVAKGLAVQDNDWMGFFNIVTVNSHRRRGLARSVSKALAEWGKKSGVRRIYLQVESDNTPAIEFY